MFLDTERTKESWLRDFGLLCGSEQHDVASQWEQKAQRLGVHYPAQQDVALGEYTWAIRCAVVEHYRGVFAEGRKADRRRVWEEELERHQTMFHRDTVLDAMEKAYQEALRHGGNQQGE